MEFLREGGSITRIDDWNALDWQGVAAVAESADVDGAVSIDCCNYCSHWLFGVRSSQAEFDVRLIPDHTTWSWGNRSWHDLFFVKVKNGLEVDATQAVRCGLQLRRTLDFRVGVLADNAVLDADLGHTARQFMEGERLRRIVQANSFTQAAQADILTRGHIQAAGGWIDVQHDALAAGNGITAQEVLDALVFDQPSNVQADAGLGAVLGLPLAWLNFFQDALIVADWNRNGLGGVGTLDGGIQEAIGIERHDGHFQVSGYG